MFLFLRLQAMLKIALSYLYCFEMKRLGSFLTYVWFPLSKMSRFLKSLQNGKNLSPKYSPSLLYSLCDWRHLFSYTSQFEEMTGAKIVGALVGSFVLAFGCDYIIADKKIFGGKDTYNSYNINDTTSLTCDVSNIITRVVYRYHSFYSFKQRVVGRNRQEVPGMASHCWSSSRHEPNQSPKFHCLVTSWILVPASLATAFLITEYPSSGEPCPFIYVDKH